MCCRFSVRSSCLAYSCPRIYLFTCIFSGSTRELLKGKHFVHCCIPSPQIAHGTQEVLGDCLWDECAYFVPNPVLGSVLPLVLCQLLAADARDAQAPLPARSQHSVVLGSAHLCSRPSSNVPQHLFALLPQSSRRLSVHRRVQFRSAGAHTRARGGE